ncbi:MAG: heat-inducible transcription repressor HrcA [Firmicutes bacterium]|jgi:heat-inducible transcriptional repressor|nr:heat-inducible transcription repressor HrcA [Bacillota bacterium]
MKHILSPRKLRILRAVVEEYICTAEPVGSRTVSRRYERNLSSATIRNEMADLEEMGFLEQPHVSAGRVPTRHGYRFYVDNLMEDVDLGLEIQDAIAISLNKANDVGKIIAEASRILSQLARHTTLILGPQFRKSSFYQMRILPLSEKKGLVVLITGNGFIKNRVIDLPQSLSAAELQQVVQYLNLKLYGLTIDQVTESLINELKRDLYRRMEILEQAFLLLEESLREEEKVRVVLGGTTNILNQPEFKDVEKIRKFLNLFEEEELLCLMLEHDNDDIMGLEVRIGNENLIEEVHECTLITSTFMIGTRSVGKIGVLGPMRMNYPEVVALVKCLAENLNQVLEAQSS